MLQCFFVSKFMFHFPDFLFTFSFSWLQCKQEGMNNRYHILTMTSESGCGNEEGKEYDGYCGQLQDLQSAGISVKCKGVLLPRKQQRILLPLDIEVIELLKS